MRLYTKGASEFLLKSLSSIQSLTGEIKTLDNG